MCSRKKTDFPKQRRQKNQPLSALRNSIIRAVYNFMKYVVTTFFQFLYKIRKNRRFL